MTAAPDTLASRQAIIAACRRLNAEAINQGTSGNVSVRIPGGLLITPSGVAYDAMRPGDIVALDADGAARPGQLEPSSEWRFHVDILRARADAGAVVHVHARFATALACLRRDIPAFHYMVAVAGGDSIRCSGYATFGTQALSDHALAALQDRTACLLANHGLIAIGRTLADAVARTVEVEALAAQYWHALQIGEPHLLSPDEMRAVLESFKTYGQNAQHGAAAD